MFAREDFISRYQRWLKHLGFVKGDPFAVYEAGKEQAHLSRVFVDRPYLHEITGNPAYPHTALLLAKRGEGKTATCEMVAYACQQGNLRRRALAVHYEDFSQVLSAAGGKPAEVTARQHIEAIMGEVIGALVNEVPGTYYDTLTDLERGLLMAYADKFGDPISQIKMRERLKAPPMPLEWQALSPLQTLQNLAQLVTCLKLVVEHKENRYESLMILVDRVDEGALDEAGAAWMLSALLREGPLLETSQVAFKFFLPVGVVEQLPADVKLRNDRLVMRTIQWDQDALRQMVDRRLQYFSDHHVESLAALCDVSARNKAMNRLIDVCNGSPRTLLRLCRKLFLYHVEHSDDILLGGNDITGAIMEFERETDMGEMLASANPLPSRRYEDSARVQTVPSSGLFIDRGNHVYLDGELFSPTLPELEFRLLKVLYQRAGKIVTHEELLRAVWEEYEMADPQNLRKLVGRVRERLEPGVAGSESRFIKSAKGRGYWLQWTPASSE